MSGDDGRLDDTTHRKVLRDRILPTIEDFHSQVAPKAILLGGQPGAGKGSLARRSEVELGFDAVTIDPDELRDFHPKVEQFRQTHPYTWSGLTHADASAWADELREAAVAGRKNLILDTTLSNGEWTSELIQDLQKQGYEVEVRVVASPFLESELGVDQRFTDALDERGYGRYVPQAAREAIYGKLPGSLDTLHERTDVPIRIFDRGGEAVYDSREDARAPGQALQAAREARLRDPSVARDLSQGWQQQKEWHRQLPQVLQDHPKVPAAVGEMLLMERAATKVTDVFDDRQIAAREVHFDVNIKPQVYHGLAVAGAAGATYDAADTWHRASGLRTRGNEVGADAQLMEFGVRNVGAWGGAFAGAKLGTLAGVKTGPGMAATGLVGGVAGYVGSEKLVDWLEDRQIHRQTDREGRTWRFDPEHPECGWTRSVREIDVEAMRYSAHDMPVYRQQTIQAGPELTRELDYKATTAAVQLRLAQPDVPVDPYRIAADASDQPKSLTDSHWTRSPDSGQWSRAVTYDFLEGVALQTVHRADPAKAVELDGYAAKVIAYNAARQPAAVAARYEQAHARAGWSEFGPVPEAVRNERAATNEIVASDGRKYARRLDGEWTHDGVLFDRKAHGNLRHELDATHGALQEHLQRMRGEAPTQEPQQLTGREPTPPTDGKRAGVSEPISPFGDPYLDRAYRAVAAGDSAALDAVAMEFARSEEGQRLAQLGRELYAQQQAEALQPQAQQTQDAIVMTR